MPPAPSLDELLTDELHDLSEAHRRRACPTLAGRSRTQPTLDGDPVVSFTSNDYLGLASDPRLAAAAAQSLAAQGTGGGASRLVSGDLPAHRSLEAALSRFFHPPAALLFPTGYQANLGLLTTLAGRDDLIVSDAANRASLI